MEHRALSCDGGCGASAPVDPFGSPKGWLVLRRDAPFIVWHFCGRVCLVNFLTRDGDRLAVGP